MLLLRPALSVVTAVTAVTAIPHEKGEACKALDPAFAPLPMLVPFVCIVATLPETRGSGFGFVEV